MNTAVRGCLRRVDVRSHGTSEDLKRAEFGAKIHFWNFMKAPFGMESGLLRHPLRVGYLTGLDALLKAQRTGLCRIMDLNFAEFSFHALG